MAQKVVREFIDDTDGSAAERTFTFAVDGTAYEIGLSARTSPSSSRPSADSSKAHAR